MTASDRNKGSALLLTLIFMITLTLITAAYFTMIRYGAINFSRQSDGVHAFYIAEAGIHKAAWYLLNTAPDGTTDGSWRTAAYPADAGSDPDDPQEESFDGGRYTMWVEDSNGAVLVTSRGIYNGSTQLVHERENFDNSAVPRTLNTVANSWGVN
jgi:Tfp pilus assembly protein PilX